MNALRSQSASYILNSNWLVRLSPAKGHSNLRICGEKAFKCAPGQVRGTTCNPGHGHSCFMTLLLQGWLSKECCNTVTLWAPRGLLLHPLQPILRSVRASAISSAQHLHSFRAYDASFMVILHLCKFRVFAASLNHTVDNVKAYIAPNEAPQCTRTSY
eukprot:1152698-Pelagomonas_calceolata.AAC.5